MVRGIVMSMILTAMTWGQEFKPTRVDVFKNGVGFFTTEGSPTFLQDKATIENLPDAIFGTFWVGTKDKNVKIDEVRAMYQRKPKSTVATSFADMLRANLNKRIVWHFPNEEKTVLQGTLIAVTDNDNGSLVTIKSAAQTHVVSSTWHAWVEFPESYSQEHIDTLFKPILEIRSAGAKGSANMEMVYFQNGIGWIPSYRVEMLDDKNAQIILAASLINDIQDIEDAEINFVVGAPHFMYENVPWPLSLSIRLNDFLSQAGRGENRPTYQRSVLANQMMMSSGESFSEDVSYTSFQPLEGTSTEDLFFYKLNRVTIKKGERAQYSIFSATVPYAHIYEVDLPKGLNQYDYEKKEEPHSVWHSIRLENKTPHPWTTGSGMTLQGGRALGQDILYYTPPKKSVNLKITTSPDIHVKDEEKEVDRKENVKQKDGYYYDLVTIEGVVTVSNSKDKEIRLSVTRPVTGKLLVVSDQAEVKQIPSLRTPINQENSLKWDVPVKSQETKKLTYRYEIFLRR